MTIVNGYATLNDYKSFISMRGLAGSVATDTSDDAVIELLIETASRNIERMTGRRFWKDTSDAVYYYTAKDGECVELPDFASITTVAVDYNNTRSYTALTASDFDYEPVNYSAEGLPIRGILLSPLSTTYFPTFRNAIKITGKRGWASVPTDVKDATLEIVNNIYASRSGQTSAGKINMTAYGVVIRPEDIPDFAMAIIKSYRMHT